MTAVIEVFADIVCPFTHVGLRRFTSRRRDAGREDVSLRILAWPLELVNGAPLDADFVADEIDELRQIVAPDLFKGFRAEVFPRSSLPAMALASAASAVAIGIGERVGLELRDLLFEQGLDLGDADLLAGVADRHGVPFSDSAEERERVLAEYANGMHRGVKGSPHYFTPGGDFFCPALDISRDAAGHLHIQADPRSFDAFIDACFDLPR
jgi:predicted DsbA family dithiol-disulfide isomerase